MRGRGVRPYQFDLLIHEYGNSIFARTIYKRKLVDDVPINHVRC